jgi:hypothetical protein
MPTLTIALPPISPDTRWGERIGDSMEVLAASLWVAFLPTGAPGALAPCLARCLGRQETTGLPGKGCGNWFDHDSHIYRQDDRVWACTGFTARGR